MVSNTTNAASARLAHPTTVPKAAGLKHLYTHSETGRKAHVDRAPQRMLQTRSLRPPVLSS